MQEIQVRFLGWEDALEGGNGNPLQYSCLEDPMGRGAWQATVHRVARVRHNLAIKQHFKQRLDRIQLEYRIIP